MYPSFLGLDLVEMPEDDRTAQTLSSVHPLISHPYTKMPDYGSPGFQSRKSKLDIIVIASYVFDWLILVVVGVVGVILGNVSPNKRPFSLQDPNISYVLPSPPSHNVSYCGMLTAS